MNKNRALEMDAVARRYGQLPSDLLKSELDDYQFDLFVASVALEEENKQSKKQRPNKKVAR